MAEITSKITELQEERHRDVRRMREILDAADAAGVRELTAEDQAEYDKLEANQDALRVRIESETRLAAAELELEQRSGRGQDFQATGAEKQVREGLASEEYARAFVGYLKRGEVGLTDEERQVLANYRDGQVKGTTSLGGYLVPEELQKQLVLHANQAGTVRQTRVGVIVTNSGEILNVPKTTAHGEATWVAETVASTSVEETFGQVPLSAYTVRRLIKVSVELVQDEAIGLIPYLGKAIGQAIGLAENDAYLNGDGTTQPTGLLTGSLVPAGKTGASGQTTSITADDVFDLFYSVIEPYRRNGEWMMADSTVKAIRKLKDTTNNYIWSPTSGVASVLANGAPDTLLGKGMWADPSMPAMAADEKSILFGDFSAYQIRDVGQAGPEASERPMGNFGVLRFDERFMDSLQYGFLGYHRTDGNLIDHTGAIKCYKNAHS